MTKRFTFPLETLLRVRRLVERDARRRLAAAQSRLAAIDDLIRRIRAEFAAQQSALRRSVSADSAADPQKSSLPTHPPARPPGVAASIDTLSVMRGRARLAHLQRMLDLQAQERASATQILRDEMKRLAAARTQTQIVEKLKDRRRIEHRDALERRDQRAADDLARQLLAMHSDFAPSPPTEARQ